MHMSRRTLYRKINKYNVDPDRFRFRFALIGRFSEQKITETYSAFSVFIAVRLPDCVRVEF